MKLNKLLIVLFICALLGWLGTSEVRAQAQCGGQCQGNSSGIQQEHARCDQDPTLGTYSCTRWTDYDSIGCICDIGPSGGYQCGRWWLQRLFADCVINNNATPPSCYTDSIAETNFFTSGCYIDTPSVSPPPATIPPGTTPTAQPTPPWPDNMNRPFILFEDLNGNQVWDYDAGERRITETCPGTNSTTVNPTGGRDWTIWLGGDGHGIDETCNVGNSEYNGPTCTNVVHCNDGDGNGTAVDCNHWDLGNSLEVEDTCFDTSTCNECHWTGDSCGVPVTSEGVMCDAGYCVSGQNNYLKDGPVTIINKQTGNWSLNVSVPTGWQYTGSLSSVSYILGARSGSCQSGLIALPVQQIPPASCSYDLTDITITNGVGGTGSGFLTNIIQSGTMANTTFTSNNPAIATVSNGFLTQTTATATGIGTTTYTAQSTMTDSTLCPVPAAVGNITVTNPIGWWQADEGSVVAAAGNITDPIPASCANNPGICDPNVVSHRPAFDPGIVTSGGQVTSGNGDISDPINWMTENDTYSGVSYDYNYFRGLISTSNEPAALTNSTITPSNLTTGGTNVNGYYLYKYTGASSPRLENTSGAAINLGSRKVILFVENPLLTTTIADRIQVNDGTGFFAIFSPGNIVVLSSVGGTVADLEGVYFTDGAFRTGSAGASSDIQLTIRGMVAANSVSLQRDLGGADGNSYDPAERFVNAPDILMNFPSFMSRSSIDWKEVAP